jgi:TRAP-type C4-dicarboxylate transport system permease small subunit
MIAINKAIVIASSIALILASAVLSYSVLTRYFFNMPTYWQDEAAVFLLVGATFMSSAFVQSVRGHIGIEAFTGFFSARVNAFRQIAVDAVSLAFCAFFSWKSWTLLHEAWINGQVTESTWAPPLWIPYSTMAVGMTLLTLQIALQLSVAIARGAR